MSDEKRSYRKKQRAADEERTRRRITEATVALHETVGPLRTTVKAVAERAGVQRATVYRHFADEHALYSACQRHWLARQRPPDPGPWARIADPEERLRTALGGLYGFYRDGEQMLHNLFRDEPHVESLQQMMPAVRAERDAVRALLMRGRPGRGGAACGWRRRSDTLSTSAPGDRLPAATWTMWRSSS
jgi:AcrR family transcriptional regulator